MSVWFRLSIELGNEAMQTDENVAEALAKVIKDVRQGHKDHVILDENGNRVGEWVYEDDGR